MAQLRLMEVVLAILFSSFGAESRSYLSVLMPNETLCGQEYITSGVVIEASHFVSNQRYFSCDIKLKESNDTRGDFQWVLRIERMFIPYTTFSTAFMLPAIHIHTSEETHTIEHQKDFANLVGKVFKTQRLSLQFVNLPQDANYQLVVALDKGDQNCTSGYQCHKSKHCIDSSLTCDEIDHCGGDGSDELDTLCPSNADLTSIIIIASGTALVILLVVLAAVSVIVCRSKREVSYIAGHSRHHRHEHINERATYIRGPRDNLPTCSKAEGPLHLTGLGYKPAPLVLKNSYPKRFAMCRQSCSNGVDLAKTHGLADYPTICSESSYRLLSASSSVSSASTAYLV